MDVSATVLLKRLSWRTLRQHKSAGDFAAYWFSQRAACAPSADTLRVDVYVNHTSAAAAAGDSMAKDISSALADFQISNASGLPSGKAVKAKKAFDLTSVNAAAKPFSSDDKAADKLALDALAVELDALQDLFYADKRFKLLVVLQGTDTSGKDGTLRGVFGRMSALGVHTIGWKAPSEAERAHDFLWRIHASVPAAGEVMVFNRSHYEDVLVPTVNGWITTEQTQQRYAHINDFERMLTETGTVVLKFLLHISKEEQRARLQDRLDDPKKHWKFALGDLEVRKRWDDYQAAYSAAVEATGTPWAPWIIVPSDSKTHRNLMIAHALKRTFEGLKLRFPPREPGLENITVV
jgi:PPK2 family polyphosphate:nucleotide phosphotransferase